MNKIGRRAMGVGLLVLLGVAGLTLKPGAAAGQVTSSKISLDYLKAMEIVRANYVEELSYDALTKASIQGMLHVLDPHSNYFDRKSFAEMTSEQRSHYFGIGAQISVRHRSTYIIEVFEDTPAARAGLRYGDQIIAVDGQDTSKWTSDRVRNVLRGERGTPVEVTVSRAGEPKPLTVTIKRDSVALPSITSFYRVRPEIGYVNLSRGFHSTTSEELESAMEELSAQGAKSFILDLRGNPGGYLDQAIKVADKFLQRGQAIVSVRGREGQNFDKQLVAENGSKKNFPLVILINRDSASASEIVAGAIQDHDRGLIVGENSFGKGLVQHIFPLRDGSGLTLTIARYYTPSGRLIQRDYSNGSLFEYYYRRSNSAEPAPSKSKDDEKRTDLGRTVYGGGGIEPDIKVANAEIFTPEQGRLYHSLFLFVRELVAGKVAGLERFKINAPVFNHSPKPDEFVITDEVLKAYREFAARFIAENPDYNLTPKAIDAEMVWARKQIRQEVFWAAYGFDVMQRATNDLDLQLQRAVAELPNSAMLSERSWRAPSNNRN